MSFRCQSQNDATAKAIVSTGFSGSTWTAACWFRRESAATSNGAILTAGGASNDNRFEMQTTANGADIRFRNTNGFDGTDNVFTVSDGEWVYVAMVCVGSSYSAYGWRDTTAEDRTTLASVTYSSITPGYCIIGGDSNTSPYWVPARGEYVHWRFWNAALTTAELNTERKSATAQKAGAIIAAPLASGTDTTQNGSGGAITITGTTDKATGTGYPVSIGAGGSVAPIVAYYQSLRANE